MLSTAELENIQEIVIGCPLLNSAILDTKEPITGDFYGFLKRFVLELDFDI